jgi:hypothetical protein
MIYLFPFARLCVAQHLTVARVGPAATEIEAVVSELMEFCNNTYE